MELCYTIYPTLRWLLAVVVMELMLSFAAHGRKKSLASRERSNGNEEAGEGRWQNESSMEVSDKDRMDEGREEVMKRGGRGQGRAVDGLDVEDSRVAM
jgi:hypothetical protein